MANEFNLNKNVDELFEKTLTNESSSIYRQKDNYIISNITLYDLDNCPHAFYPKVILDANPVKCEKDNLVKKSQNNWINYYTNKNKFLPSLPLLYAILEVAYDYKDETTTKELLTSLANNSYSLTDKICVSDIATSTRFNYEKNKVWHNIATPNQIEFNVKIPRTSQGIDELVSRLDWKRPLKSIFMTNNVEKIPSVLRSVCKGKESKFYTPYNARYIERATFVQLHDEGLKIDNRFYFSETGHSHGVRIKDSKTPRVLKKRKKIFGF